MIEVTIVMMVMLVAVSIFSKTVLSISSQREVNRENALAAEAARVAIETMLNASFEDRFALYNQNPADDPSGPGTGPGHRFPVPGLTPLPEAADGMVGEFVFPAVLTKAGWQLREDSADATLGMPRDLNGDRVVDDQDHAADYIQFPLLVRMRWIGRSGRREFRVFTQMADYQW